MRVLLFAMVSEYQSLEVHRSNFLELSRQLDAAFDLKLSHHVPVGIDLGTNLRAEQCGAGDGEPIAGWYKLRAGESVWLGTHQLGKPPRMSGLQVWVEEDGEVTVTAS